MRVPGTDWVIPPTHTLLASPGVLARSEEFFSQPMEWNPHRWDKGPIQNPEDDLQRVDYGFGLVSKAVGSPYLPFGAGRHRCVGEQYAYAQLGAIIATLVRLLKWEQVDTNAPVPATDYSVRCSFILLWHALMASVYVLPTHESCNRAMVSARVNVSLTACAVRQTTYCVQPVMGNDTKQCLPYYYYT